MQTIDSVIDLLKQVIEQGDVDGGVRISLEEAVQQLSELRGKGALEKDQREKALFWIGKAFEAIPEIAKLANKLFGG